MLTLYGVCVGAVRRNESFAVVHRTVHQFVILLFSQPVIGRPTIRVDDTTTTQELLDYRQQGFCLSVRYRGKEKFTFLCTFDLADNPDTFNLVAPIVLSLSEF